MNSPAEAFAVERKVAALQLVRKQLTYQEGFKKLGPKWAVPHWLVYRLESIFAIYMIKIVLKRSTLLITLWSTLCMNTYWMPFKRMFRSKWCRILVEESVRQLPLCSDFHILRRWRADFLAIWRPSPVLTSGVCFPLAQCHGWHVSKFGQLEVLVIKEIANAEPVDLSVLRCVDCRHEPRCIFRE